MNGQRIGYARVSSFDQNLERQVVVQALRDAGYADDSLRPHLLPLGWEQHQPDGRLQLVAELASRTGLLPPLIAAQSALAHNVFRFTR